jgi:hypothetical protein
MPGPFRVTYFYDSYDGGEDCWEGHHRNDRGQWFAKFHLTAGAKWWAAEEHNWSFTGWAFYPVVPFGELSVQELTYACNTEEYNFDEFLAANGILKGVRKGKGKGESSTTSSSSGVSSSSSSSSSSSPSNTGKAKSKGRVKRQGKKLTKVDEEEEAKVGEQEGGEGEEARAPRNSDDEDDYEYDHRPRFEDAESDEEAPPPPPPRSTTR